MKIGMVFLAMKKNKLDNLELAISGYDAFAYIKNLQILAAIAADDSALALLYKTHPTPEQRFESLAGQMNKLANNQGLLLDKRFAQVMN